MPHAGRNPVLGHIFRQYDHPQRPRPPFFSQAARQDRRNSWHDGKSRSFATSVTSQAPPRALIVGGGPAGCTTAYFLAKAGFDVTVSERSTRPPYGQGIDITNRAVDVVKRMDILNKIKANTTGETGFALLDDEGKQIGSLLGFNVAQHESVDQQRVFSPTNELEIMRGTLNKMLAKAAKEKHAKFRYGCTISGLEQYPDRVDAVLSDRQQVEPYSVVIGADGVGSRVRKLAFPSETLKTAYSPTNTYAAYFSMSVEEEDRRSYSRLQQGGRGRALWLRPIDRQGARQTGYFITTTPTSTELDKLDTSGNLATREQQQSNLEALHDNMRGIKDLVVRGMYECNDWHFTRLAQIKLPTWHGRGTSMALIGSYILAGKLASNPTDPQAAFAAYKRVFDPYVHEEGKIPFGGRAQNIFVPESRFALWSLRQLYRAFSYGYGSTLLKLASAQNKAEDAYKLPMYPI
ncbi:hypothetical protein NU195Hw_Modified_439t1 [Hortaea werneckii]